MKATRNNEFWMVLDAISNTFLNTGLDNCALIFATREDAHNAAYECDMENYHLVKMVEDDSDLGMGSER